MSRGSARLGTARWQVALGCAAAYAALAVPASRRPGRVDEAAFRLLNERVSDSPLWLVPQQLGTPWLLPGIAGAALVVDRPRLALAAAAAVPVEKAAEVATKKLSRRPRPVQALADVQLRDDAPAEGPSYPSGHTALTVVALWLLAPHLPRAWVAGLGGLAVAGGARRVHQGAHYPSDVLGGVLLGCAVGAGLDLAASSLTR